MFKIGKLYFSSNNRDKSKSQHQITRKKLLNCSEITGKVVGIHLFCCIQQFFLQKDFTQNNLQSIFQQKHMDFENFLVLEAKEDLMSGSTHPLMLHEEIELLPVERVPNFESFFHDSLTKMEEIMSFIDELELPEAKPDLIQSWKEPVFSKKATTRKSHFQDYAVVKSQKKIKKSENSPFHNYQKHLNNALKKLVIVPSSEENEEEYKQAARQIWTAYVNGDVKTKKILHFVFNEKNEHQIKESELKSFGLLSVYQHFGKNVISRAKSFLSKLAIDQIDIASVQGYVKTRKMKKTCSFTEYVLNFRKELLSGYIKRRVHLFQRDN